MTRDRLKQVAIEVLLAVVVLLVFVTYKFHRKVESLESRVAAQSQPPAAVYVSIDDDDVTGDFDAPVTVVEFTDYTCGLCARYYMQIYPQIHQKYIETGKVQWVVRNFPSSPSPHAQKAAEAAECAGEQGDYYGMHYMLYEHQADLGIDNYKKWARELGLDGAQFDQCLDSGAMAEEVRLDMIEGYSYGVEGTPVFFVNGEKLTGAKPFEVIDDAIQRALGETP
jgi:protein-disulfide isomerase